MPLTRPSRLASPVGEGELLGETLLCPSTEPSAPLQLLGAPDAAPGASPALSAALQQPLGSPTQEDAGVEGGTVPLWVHCPCPEVESSPTSSLQQLSPRFPLKDLHSLASRAVSLSFLPLLLESCTDESTGL